MSLKKRFEGKDTWEKINGNKQMVGAIIFGLGLISAFIPFAQTASPVLISAGGTLWGIGKVHSNHKKNGEK